MPRATHLPDTVTARARARGRFPFAFGPRFFTSLLLGLAALSPSCFFPRAVFLMFAWDALVLLLWLADAARLPRPAQLEVERVWKTRPSLSAISEIQLRIANNGWQAIQV